MNLQQHPNYSSEFPSTPHPSVTADKNATTLDQHRSQSQENDLPKPSRWFNTRDKLGVGVVVIVYLLFIKIYVFTMWKALSQGISENEGSSIVNAIVFTIFFLLALLSHFQCMTT